MGSLKEEVEGFAKAYILFLYLNIRFLLKFGLCNLTLGKMRSPLF